MNHVKPVNRKARMVERAAKHGAGDVKALQSLSLGCSLIFDPGWETDAAGGVSGLCQPVEADLYGCYDDCWWPAQVPDQLTNYLSWSDSCAAAERDWRKLDLIYPDR
jgi:hypothetical protein